jgi:SAM-dependent methyltransferase
VRKFVKKAAVAAVEFSSRGQEVGAHVTRFVMYDRLREVGRQVRPPAGSRILSISRSRQLCAVLGLDDHEVIEVDYPDVSVLDLPFPEGHFDAVVSDQVFEHIEGNPFEAMEETLRVLKPGGLVVHTTCFINPVHAWPGDFWRFTPEALELLMGEKAEIVTVGGWGNRLVWVAAALGLRKTPVPRAKWHPLHWVATRNEPKWPVATWVVAHRAPAA